MFASNIVIGFAVIGVLSVVSGLEQSREASATDILRDTVNRIFTILKLGTNRNAKLKEYLTIHKYFVSVTSLESQNRKEVTKLIKLDTKTDNGTRNFTTAINEALSEQNINEKVNSTNDDEINKYVENFLTTLAQLKGTFLVNNSYGSINSAILQHFNIPNVNQSNIVDNEVDSNENATDENEFWVPMETRRIYRGETTKIKYFPFVASVQIFNQFTCAGSIIKSDLVITAASCLQLAHNNRFYRENPAFLSVRVGSTFYNGGGENIPVMEVYFYPTYTPKTLRDNVAIMRLLRALKFKKKQVKKIATDENAHTLPLNTDGITIVGWGAKTTSNKVHDPWKNRLSMDVLDIYPLDDCQDIYSKKYVTKKHFCAGFLSKGGGACNRDVGAPGLVSGVLTGVVSFGSPTCGAVDAPTVFTKLGYYANWIEEIKSEETETYQARTTTRLPYTQTILSTFAMDDYSFKLEPIERKGAKPSFQNKALRSDQQQVFKEFLKTVFNSKEAENYESKLSGFSQKKGIEEGESEDKNEKKSVDLTRTGNNTEEISEEEIGQEKGVTNMGNAEADDVESEESDVKGPASISEEIPQGNTVETYHDTKKTVVTTPKDAQIKQKKAEEETEEGLSIEDIVRQGDDSEDGAINIDDDIDKHVDQLIKNLDIEKGSSELVEKSDENKVIGDNKLKEIRGRGNDRNEKNDNADETILTLLYLSDTERKAADLKISEDQKSEEDEGMSIDTRVGNDPLRTNNVTNKRHEYISKDEMYDILVDAIKS